MRYVFRIGFAFALGLALMAGCSDENGEGGSGGTAGTGGEGGNGGQGGVGGSPVACADFVCPCTEAGILAAIAEGGEEPFTFDCDGPTTVVTKDTIVIDNDVILDGEGNLTVDGNEDHRVFLVRRVVYGEDGVGHLTDVTAELRGFTVSGGNYSGIFIRHRGTLTLTDSTVSNNTIHGGNGGGGIENSGTLTLTNSTVSDNTATLGRGGGISNGGTLTLTNSTVSGNTGEYGGGISNGGTLTLTNSTVSYNMATDIRDGRGGGISNGGTLTLTNSTVSNNTTLGGGGGIWNAVTLTLINSTVSGNVAAEGSGILNFVSSSAGTLLRGNLIDGECVGPIASAGHNIESPGNTCGFENHSVPAQDLALGLLTSNGGPTMTHRLTRGSVAIDQIPEDDCVDADGEPLTTDQRGQPRPVAIVGAEPKCDVGAFEVQPY